MAKRGDFAREEVKQIIINAFGDNFVGIQDKKIYVKAKDAGGEVIQFCINITMPKEGFNANKADTITVNPNDWGASTPRVFSTESNTSAAVNEEISQEDRDKVG